MSKKTIILTQSQLNEVLGYDATYLDAANKDFRENGGANEVFVGAKDDENKKDADPATTDKVQGEMGQADNWFTISRAKTLGTPSPLFCAKKADFINKMSLMESNSELEGQYFQIDPTTLRALRTAYTSSASNNDDKGRESLANAINNKGISYTEATTLKSRFDNLSPSSKEYQDLGGKSFHDFLNRVLQSKTDMVKRSKDFKKDILGMNNAYQKPGGMKMSGNGQAHTPKNTNSVFGRQ